jgi:hypothetical protein
MFSWLASLSITGLQKLDEEADDIVLRTHPLNEVTSLIHCYVRHVLRPQIDLWKPLCTIHIFVVNIEKRSISTILNVIA